VGTFVGNTGTCAGGGLAFGPDGTLYFTGFTSCVGNPALHVLNPATAAILRSAPMAFFYDALGARPTDGALFATTGGTGGSDLFYIDPATGIQIFWGSATTGLLSDLAFR
jgi:hypothetical protein